MAKRRGALTSVPEDFVVMPHMFKWAAQQGLEQDVVVKETAKFLDRNRAKGELYVDWEAAWRNWMRNVIEYRAQRGIAYQTSIAVVSRKRLN